MPLFTVTMKAGRADDEKNAISRAIHEASVNAGYPEDDMFQRFFCLEQTDLKVDLNYPGLPKPRTEKMLMIEVLVSSGTDADRKTRLLAALVEALDGAGTDPNESWCSSERSIAPVAPSAAVALRHQSQASNHATSWSQRYAQRLYGPEGEVVRRPPNFAPVPYCPSNPGSFFLKRNDPDPAKPPAPRTSRARTLFGVRGLPRFGRRRRLGRRSDGQGPCRRQSRDCHGIAGPSSLAGEVSGSARNEDRALVKCYEETSS